MEAFITRLTEMFSFSQVRIVSIVFILLSCGLLLKMVYEMVQIEQQTKSIQKSYNKGIQAIGSSMNHARLKMFNYDEINRWINSTGLAFMFKGLTPLRYLVMKVCVGVVFAIFGFYAFGLLAGVVAFMIGFVFIDFIAQQSNSGDNKQMLTDLKAVYDTLRIQTKAGIYTSQILSECFLVVQNKRLRDALMKLTTSITLKNDIEGSLEEFRSKFSNDYIDSLALIIKQSLVTGLSTQMYEDIKIQMESIEMAMLAAEKQSISNKITMVQLLLYISVIAVSVFIAIIAVMDSLAYMA